MFKKKKQQTQYSSYDISMERLLEDKLNTIQRMKSLFREIQESKLILDCFEKDSSDFDSELIFLKNKKYALLTVCGHFDGILRDMREIQKNHENELTQKWCFPNDNQTCHDMLRLIAINYIETN